LQKAEHASSNFSEFPSQQNFNHVKALLHFKASANDFAPSSPTLLPK